jgi:hypothetical protein
LAARHLVARAPEATPKARAVATGLVFGAAERDFISAPPRTTSARMNPVMRLKLRPIAHRSTQAWL